MVVAFYPGGGGNRYLRYLKKKQFDKKDATYDNINNLNVLHKYPHINDLFNDNNTILTHCVNYPLLVSTFPNQSEFIFIKSDIKKSLNREFILEGYKRYIKNEKIEPRINQMLEHYSAFKDASWPNVSTSAHYFALPEVILTEVINNFGIAVSNNKLLDCAFFSICYHMQYYSQYPFNAFNSTVIDISNENNMFCNVMKRELNTPINDVFNFAWDAFCKYGKNAEVQQLYRNQ